MAIDNKVCISIAPIDDERVIAFSLQEINNRNNRINNNDLNLRIASGSCVPTDDFIFQPGKSYTFGLTLNSEHRRRNLIVPSTRDYVASFKLETEHGMLKIVTLD